MNPVLSILVLIGIVIVGLALFLLVVIPFWMTILHSEEITPEEWGRKHDRWR